VQNNAGVYNPGICVSDAHYRHGCENYDTERANVKPQYCERNDSRSRYMEARSTCKIHWQGANVGAGVDGFEKNASQNTRRPSAQPVNVCLECLFIKNCWKPKWNQGEYYCENCLRLKFVGDYKTKRNVPINQKHSDFERDIAQKENL